MTNGFVGNTTSLTTSRTFPGTYNGGVFGPYAIAVGVTLGINTGATFTII